MPFALPPIEGLQGILATILKLSVINKVFLLSFALAKHASTPACPPPTTITS